MYVYLVSASVLCADTVFRTSSLNMVCLSHIQSPETPHSETYIFPYKLLLLLSFVSCPVATYYSIFHRVISQFCVYLFICMKFIFYDSRMMPSLLKDSLAFDFCVITIVSYYFHKYYILCSCC